MLDREQVARVVYDTILEMFGPPVNDEEWAELCRLAAAGRLEEDSEVALAFAAADRLLTAGGREVASIMLDEVEDWGALAEMFGATLRNHEEGDSGDYVTGMHLPNGRSAWKNDRLVIVTDAELPPDLPAPLTMMALRAAQLGRSHLGSVLTTAVVIHERSTAKSSEPVVGPLRWVRHTAERVVVGVEDEAGEVREWELRPNHAVNCTPAPQYADGRPHFESKLLPSADELNELLMAINDSGADPVVVGFDRHGSPFLAYGRAPGGDGWAAGFVDDDPHSAEFDYGDGNARCGECGAFSRRSIDKLSYPVTVIPAAP